MKLSPREWMLSGATACVGLFAVSYWFAQPKAAAWPALRETQRALRLQIENADRRLAPAMRHRWTERMDRLRTKLSKYPADRDVTADYLKIIEHVAQAQSVTLGQRKPQKEKQVGDQYELAIDCTWEADLDALVHFLYALEQEHVTMDIEELSVTLMPGGKGRLKGNFTLMCIYVREPVPTGGAGAPGVSPAPMEGKAVTNG